MRSAIRVLLADDHGVVREGIGEFLEEQATVAWSLKQKMVFRS